MMLSEAEIRAELDRMGKLPWGGRYDALDHAENALKWVLGDGPSPIRMVEGDDGEPAA